MCRAQPRLLSEWSPPVTPQKRWRRRRAIEVAADVAALKKGKPEALTVPAVRDESPEPVSVLINNHDEETQVSYQSRHCVGY